MKSSGSSATVPARGAGHSARDEAQRYGCDMALLAESMARTPRERVEAHRRALNAITMLKAAGERARG